MSRHTCLWLAGVLVVGMGMMNSKAAVASGSLPTLNPDELPYRMKAEGARKPVNLALRADLSAMMEEATTRAREFEPSCETQAIYEIQMMREGTPWIDEVFAQCEDSPTPAIALYFDVNKTFLTALDLAN
jgi:hypothetical protein